MRSPSVNDPSLLLLQANRRVLSDAELDELSSRISPLVREGDDLYRIEPVEPRHVSFIWDPQFVDKMEAWQPIGRIQTLHSLDHGGRFKPTIAEVLCMIPEELMSEVTAFEVFGPEDAADLRRQRPAIQAGFHVATTILYGV